MKSFNKIQPFISYEAFNIMSTHCTKNLFKYMKATRKNLTKDFLLHMKHLTFYNINHVKTKIALLKPTFIYFNMTI